MFDLRLCLFACVNLFLLAKCTVPTEILCANPTCKEPISKAVGSVTYASSARNVLSFKPGEEIIITSKSKNKNDYWGAIINGRMGYVPSNLVKEVRIYHKFDDLIPISVEALIQQAALETAKSDLPQNNVTVTENSVKQKEPDQSGSSTLGTVPNPLDSSSSASVKSEGGLKNELPSSEAFKDTVQVIEGTTVYMGGGNQITPSTTAQTNPQTAIPVSNVRTAAEEEVKRATIPPEVINLNADYKGQLLLEKNNLTVEEAEEEDDVEGDEDEDEEDDIDDLEEDLEDGDNYPPEEETLASKAQEEEVKRSVDVGLKESEVAANKIEPKETIPPTVSTLQPQPEISKDLHISHKNNATEIKTESVSAIDAAEHSVTSEVTSQVSVSQDETTPKLEKEIPESTPMPSTEADVKFGTDTPAIELDKPFTNEVLTEKPVAQNVYQGVTPSPPPLTELLTENSERILHQHHTTPPSPPVFIDTQTVSNQFSVGADSVPDNARSNDGYQKQNVDLKDLIQEKVELTSEAPGTNFFPATESAQIVESKQKNVPETQTENVVMETVTDKPKEEVIFTERPSEETESLTLTPEPLTQAPSEMTTENVEVKPEEPGIFSQVSEMFSGWFGSKNEELIDRNDLENTFTEVPKVAVPEENAKVEFVGESRNNPSPDSCPNPDSDCNHITEEQQPSFLSSWGLPSNINFDGAAASSNIFLYLVVTAVTVLLFTLGHNYIEKKGKTGPLIAKINKLEQELLVTSKECGLLKDEVQNARDKITLYENSANDELVLSLQAELEEAKKTKVELETSIEVLQQELDAATEAGLDLNKMLSEVLTQKGGSESLLESVENLQAQLNSQQKVIDEMTKKLGVKNQENEALQSALETANEKVENLEEQLTDINHNLNIHLKEKEELTLDLNSQISQLQVRIHQMGENKEKEILKLNKKVEELSKKHLETSSALSIKQEELKALKDSIRQLKSKGNVNFESLFDVSQIKGELANAEKEKKSLEVKLKEEEVVKKSLEEQSKALELEVQKLKKSFEEAEQKKDEAEKKLEVLSTYFKEKETQLQKELGLQEALWAQKKGDEKTVYNMMKSLQEEVESYKSQNETLKKEILDQERGLKNQIATLEQKAHENWVAARQAERKLEESKQELAQLRNRLTLVEKNNSNIEGKVNHRTTEELNGEPPTSPVLHDTSSPLLFPPPLPLDPNSSSLLPPGFMPHPMFMPPPIGGFIPPPPFLPGDRRPPPLGRMSSPPLNSRFSPSSPTDYPFERMSSPPLSPSARNYRSPNEADRQHFRHRTPPYPPLNPRNWDDNNEMPGFIPISSQRDSLREHKGSNVSSGHSSSDSLDKSSRHSGRV